MSPFKIETHGSMFVVTYQGRFISNCETRKDADDLVGALTRYQSVIDDIRGR